MLKHGFFTFHIVELSPWPFYASLGLVYSVIGLIESLSLMKVSFCGLVGNLLILMVLTGWMRDIVRESTMMGFHTLKVQNGLKLGFILFIVSEIFFFFSFFWGLFYNSISPNLGWPHPNISCIDPFNVPLLGTIILISSGISITWCHHSVLENKNGLTPLFLTIFLGVSFTIIQLLEYYQSSFTMSDGAFGSFFFVCTGFHGIHVIIGSIFLFISFFRMKLFHFSYNHHVGFEAATWYWHFVDVVWLFLYISVYWWPF